jgi:hypothetical protein
MQKNIILNIITFFCVLSSCTRTPIQDPYLLSHLPNVQAFEKQDHKFCDSLKLNFDKSDNLSSKIYWRCRLSLAKYRLYPDNMNPNFARSNSEVSDLITKISLKLANTSESILIRENKKMDNRQHKQCLIMGFVIDTEDQAKIDDYFACRRALIEDQQLVPPFGNIEYLKYPNSSYDLGFAINQRIDDRIQKYNSFKKQYPTCIKFNLNNVNFKNCIAAQEASKKCFTEIEKKRFKKEGEEKTICQKQAYIRFPNELLKDEDSRARDIERMKKNSDYYNRYSLSNNYIPPEKDSDKGADAQTQKESSPEYKIFKCKKPRPIAKPNFSKEENAAINDVFTKITSILIEDDISNANLDMTNSFMTEDGKGGIKIDEKLFKEEKKTYYKKAIKAISSIPQSPQNKKAKDYLTSVMQYNMKMVDYDFYCTNKAEEDSEAAKINSKTGLYSRFELTKLRQKYIFECQQAADSRVVRYVEELKESCNNAAKFDIVGEQ